MRKVVEQDYKEQIWAVIATKTSDPRGQGNWLSHFPAAVTTVMNSLTDEQLEEVRQEADRQSETGAPRHVQRR